MKNERIAKLINDYKKQINFYDDKINYLISQIRNDRRKGLDYTLIAEEKKVVDAQRQRTIEFISDLESI